MAYYWHRKPRINPFGSSVATNTLGRADSIVFGITGLFSGTMLPLGYSPDPPGSQEDDYLYEFPSIEEFQILAYPFGVGGPSPIDII